VTSRGCTRPAVHRMPAAAVGDRVLDVEQRFETLSARRGRRCGPVDGRRPGPGVGAPGVPHDGRDAAGVRLAAVGANGSGELRVGGARECTKHSTCPTPRSPDLDTPAGAARRGLQRQGDRRRVGAGRGRLPVPRHARCGQQLLAHTGRAGRPGGVGHHPMHQAGSDPPATSPSTPPRNAFVDGMHAALASAPPSWRWVSASPICIDQPERGTTSEQLRPTDDQVPHRRQGTGDRHPARRSLMFVRSGCSRADLAS
jgi:hypothetical protein